MESSNTQNHTSKQKHWGKHISCWKESCLSQKQYCLRHGIAISTFSYWKRKLINLHETPGPKRFFALTVKDAGPALSKQEPPTGIRLSLCNDKFKIDLEKEFSETTLRKLIATLETI